MKIVNTQQMKKEDKEATERYGIPSIILMENAASESVKYILEEYKNVKSAAIVCGGGNNGGDGFAIARRLVCRGINVAIYKCFDETRLTPDALTNFNSVKALSIPETEGFEGFDIIIDCLLGIGIVGNVREEAAEIIRKINGSGKPVVSIDVPGGLDADEGFPHGMAVRADLTVTMGYGKPGLYTGEGKKYAGKIVVADISLPPNTCGELFLTDESLLEAWLPENDVLAHKGSNGTLVAVAGSVGMTGAAALSCQAALRTGAGIVKLAVPKNLNCIMEVKLTEAMTFPVLSEDFFTEQDADIVLNAAENAKAMLIGPGLGRNEQTVNFVHKIIRNADVPLIIDADGIYAVSMNIDILKEAKQKVILTPHPGEFSMLTGIAPSEINSRRVALSAEFAKKYGVTLLLKGPGSVIAAPDGRVYINPTGNEGMAKGGSGDVLSGIIAALVCRNAENPAAAGAFVHGRAGDMAVEILGKNNMLPSDIIKYINYI